ncbi:MAG TPA: hypothetical protein DCY25_01530 [Bacteroidales bacterium]|nr:hypothetical protein [Bacteroidales bacterium]
MRDGVKLFTSVYTPKNSTSPRPVLLNRTPYNIEGGGLSGINKGSRIYDRRPAFSADTRCLSGAKL